MWCDARGHLLSSEGCLFNAASGAQTGGEASKSCLESSWHYCFLCSLWKVSLGTGVVMAKWLNLGIPTHVYRHRLWCGITTHPVSYSCICFLMLYPSMINNCLWDRGRWSYSVSSLQRTACLLATISQFGKNKFFLGTETSTQLQYQYTSWIYLNLIFLQISWGFLSCLFVCVCYCFRGCFLFCLFIFF